jgi:DNA-binding winged helix-turn-helix (wHTH) protein
MSAEPIDTALPIAIAAEGATAAIDLTEPFYLGDWRIDPPLRRASKGETVVKIDPRNLRVLQILVERRGQLVSQREIETLAWEGVIVTPDSLYQSIRQLRQALGDTKSPAKYIETVPRRGYRLVADVLAAQPQRENFSCCSLAPPTTAAEEEIFAKPGTTQLRSRHAYLAAAAVIACSGAATLGYVGLSRPDRAEVARIIGGIDHEVRGMQRLDVQSLRERGRAARIEGRPREALAYFEDALYRQLAQTGERNEAVADILTDVANTRLWLDDETAAHTAAMRAVSIIEELAPASSPERADALRVLAEVLISSGEYLQADRLLDESIILVRNSLGERHIIMANCLSLRSVLRRAQGQLSEAAKIAREVLELYAQTTGPQTIFAAEAHIVLAGVLVDSDMGSEAEEAARTAISILRDVAEETHPYMVSSRHVLAEALLRQARYTEAEMLLREELAVLERENAVEWRVARAASSLGEALLSQAKFVDAENSLSLARTKLVRTKGWPIERENRNLERRLQLLADMRVK